MSVTIGRWIVILITLATILLSIATLFIAFSSGQTILVIENNLSRHVDQRLIERALSAIVSRELNLQNFWLIFNGFFLLFIAILNILLYSRNRAGK